MNHHHHHQKHPNTKQYKLIHSVSSWHHKKVEPVRTDLPRFMTASTMGSVNPPCLTTYDLEGRGSSDIPQSSFQTDGTQERSEVAVVVVRVLARCKVMMFVKIVLGLNMVYVDTHCCCMLHAVAVIDVTRGRSASGETSCRLRGGRALMT